MSPRVKFVMAISLLLVSLGEISARADETIFSGPQVGEELPSFKARMALGEQAGKEFDFVEQAAGKPVLLIFFHARTRPAFGMTKAITSFALSKAPKGLQTCVIFLTDDPTETGKWLNNIQQQFPKGVSYGISHDGLEGPGSYGLNRNVALTILVGNQGKVTANSALIQPQLQADGPKIIKAIVDATGGGKVPTVEELQAAGGARMAAAEQPTRQTDSQLAGLLRAVINKQSSPDAVKQAAAAVEKYVDENEPARKELARITTTIVDSGKLSNYGTETAQEILRGWRKKYGAASARQPAASPEE